MDLNQYEIVLVNLDPTVGSEIKKTRPCVVISPNEMNRYLRTITIAPMTTKSHPYPTRLKIKHNSTDGWVVIDQLRTIDKIRVIKKVGALSTDEIQSCKAIIRETFVD
jgi:mRNA interferase MazF